MTTSEKTALKQMFKSNFVTLFLSKIEWNSKEVAGQIDSCYAYTSNPSSKVECPEGLLGNLSISVGEAKKVGGVTIWLGEMTDEMYQLYLDNGYEQVQFNIDEGKLVDDSASDDSEDYVEQPSA